MTAYQTATAPHGSNQAGQAAYRLQAVSTASPAQLVVMLYDRAIAAVVTSDEALREGGTERVETAHFELTRAQDILTELTVSLDRERGGMLAVQLAAIYDWCQRVLMDANVRKNPAGLPAIADHLGQLREAFATAARGLDS